LGCLLLLSLGTVARVDFKADSVVISSGGGVISDSGIAILSLIDSSFTVRERFLRAEDSVRSVDASISAGILAGGGVSFVIAGAGLSSDSLGTGVVVKSLSVPLSTLLNNSGISSGLILSYLSRWSSSVAIGINPVSGAYLDLVREGVIDASLVVLSAIESAGAISVSILASDCLSVFSWSVNALEVFLLISLRFLLSLELVRVMRVVLFLELLSFIFG
jgi:hypothetical protein